nr:lamin tail domain-containing protein [Myxococcota bacterium]
VLAIAPRGEATLELGSLAASAIVPATLTAIDAAGRSRVLELALSTTEPLPLVAITEVRADPYGAEPRQEYVELENRGLDAVDLLGFSLADSPTAAGDVIASSHRLAPGARALLVAEAFDPDDRGDGDRDAPVPPGVALIRVDRSLASGGLSNAGEPLFLRDPGGRRISAAPAEPPPRPGVCTVRTSDDARTGARGSFDYDAASGCTPGR